MNRLMVALQNLIERLEPRERRILVAGATLVVVTGCILLLSMEWQKRQSLVAGQRILVDELAWMQEQAELLGDLASPCAQSGVIGTRPPREHLNALVSRHGLQSRQLDEPAPGRFRLRLVTDDGNALLAFVHESVCQRFGLAALTLTQDPEAESGPITADLELTHAR